MNLKWKSSWRKKGSWSTKNRNNLKLKNAFVKMNCVNNKKNKNDFFEDVEIYCFYNEKKKNDLNSENAFIKIYSFNDNTKNNDLNAENAFVKIYCVRNKKKNDLKELNVK